VKRIPDSKTPVGATELVGAGDYSVSIDEYARGQIAAPVSAEEYQTQKKRGKKETHGTETISSESS